MPDAIAILIAEDEALLRMVAHDVLVEAGYSVIEAVNAGEALLLLDARPDTRVLFTDVRMPGSLDGFALAHIVSRKCPYVGILVASGDLRPRPADLPPGARFLPKPYSPSALLEAIADMAAQQFEAQPVALDMPYATDATPSAQAIPTPVQEPDK